MTEQKHFATAEYVFFCHLSLIRENFLTKDGIPVARANSSIANKPKNIISGAKPQCFDQLNDED